MGIACAAITFGALSNFSVLESIHVDLGAAIHEIRDSSRAQEIAAVRFDRRQSTTSLQTSRLSVDAGTREHTLVPPSKINIPSGSHGPQPVDSSSIALTSLSPHAREDAHSNLATLWEAPSAGGCSNTGQGRRLVTDSQGFTCDRTTLSGADTRHQGCCPRHQRHLLALPSTPSTNVVATTKEAGTPAAAVTEPWFGPASAAETALLLQGNSGTTMMSRYSCASCDPASQCCEVYELCVACCMDPQLQPQREALQAR